jgi:hypothetical protein
VSNQSPCRKSPAGPRQSFRAAPVFKPERSTASLVSLTRWREEHGWPGCAASGLRAAAAEGGGTCRPFGAGHGSPRPTVRHLRTLGLIDTYWPLIAPALIGTSPFYVLLFYWSFRRLPQELFDA